MAECLLLLPFFLSLWTGLKLLTSSSPEQQCLHGIAPPVCHPRASGWERTLTSESGATRPQRRSSPLFPVLPENSSHIPPRPDCPGAASAAGNRAPFPLAPPAGVSGRAGLAADPAQRHRAASPQVPDLAVRVVHAPDQPEPSSLAHRSLWRGREWGPGERRVRWPLSVRGPSPRAHGEARCHTGGDRAAVTDLAEVPGSPAPLPFLLNPEL